MSRRVVITGGAAGLGRAMAEAFLAAGDRVAVCDADPEAVAALRAEVPEIRAEVADVTDPAALGAFFGGLEADWAGVDVVCANAGTGGPAGHVEDIGYEEWRHCLAVNLDGAFLTCRWAAPVMRRQGHGLILLTSSISGLFGFPQRAPYVAAKWGIVGLTKALASELGPAGVRVNAICPGSVEGPRMDRVISMEAAARGLNEEDVRRGFTEGVALRRFVKAGEVAAMALFLASEGAVAITGQALVVDGHTERVT